MDIATIIKSIAEIGVLGVCAAIVIWQAYNDRVRESEREKNYAKQIETIIEDLKKQNDKMLGQIIQKVDMGHIIGSEEDENISKIEKELEYYLSELRQNLNANRVSIFRYHNGGKDYNGKSFLRMSMTNEVVSCGTALIQPQLQNLFRSMYFSLTHSLDTDGTCYIENIEDLKEMDYGFYSYLKNFGIKAKYSIALCDPLGKIIGFLTADFAENEKVNRVEIIHSLEEKKIKIETLLNL